MERTRSTHTSRSGLFWMLAILYAAGVAGVYQIFVRTAWGHGIEDAALVGRTFTPQRILWGQLTFLDVVSVGSLALASAVLIGIAVFRNRPALAMAIGAMILGSNVTTQILKQSTLVRPDLAEGVGFVNNSFPSGHATVAMSIAVALIMVVPSRFRWAAAFTGTTYAAITGAAVVAVGWHRPSDAVGAWMVVGAWTAGVLAVLAGSGHLPVMRPIRRSVVATLGFFGAVVVLAGMAIIGGVIAVDEWLVGESFTEIRRAAAFATGTAGVIGAAALSVGVLLAALGGTSIGRRSGVDRPVEDRSRAAGNFAESERYTPLK